MKCHHYCLRPKKFIDFIQLGFECPSLLGFLCKIRFGFWHFSPSEIDKPSKNPLCIITRGYPYRVVTSIFFSHRTIPT